MPRLSLTYVLPVILFFGTIILFIHGWTRPEPQAGAPAASVAAQPGTAPAGQSSQGG